MEQMARTVARIVEEQLNRRTALLGLRRL
jgi:hypothetical protein